MNLATWWGQATPGVTYWRCDIPARHLPGKVCQLRDSDIRETTTGFQFPRQEGAAIWSFSGNTTRALFMAGMQEECGIPVFMELDDNYRIAPPVASVSRWVEKRSDAPARVVKLPYGLSERIVGREDVHSYETCTDIARFCDGLIVSTPNLAGVYADVNENIHVCPNSVDPDDWPEPPEYTDRLRVGWAASDSHLFDADLIRDALYWASTQKNLEVVVIGINPQVSRFRFDYRYVPWANNVADYRRNVGEIDVMLCPIIPDEWSNAKSDVKALEAAMAGACSIVSAVEPYRPWFDKPAYVARHPWDFKKLLKHLARYPDEALETARLAREYVLSERTISQSIHKWREAIESV